MVVLEMSLDRACKAHSGLMCVATWNCCRMTLELSDVILRQFHVATHTSPEWALQALSNDISNTTTERFKLYRKFLGPMSGLQ